MIYLLELNVINPSSVAEVLYFSTKPYNTLPSEIPANTHYHPRLRPGSLNLNLFTRSSIGGATRIGLGEIQLINNDGEFDYLNNYTISGQYFTILRGIDKTTPRNQMVTVSTGQVSRVDMDFDTIDLTIYDELNFFDKPLTSSVYTGTNVLPDGLDGTLDIKGKTIPRVYGTVKNIEPVLVNTSLLIYQVSDKICSIDAMYNRGSSWTQETDYASEADLLTESDPPSAGCFRVYESSTGSYFRLGSSPDGQVTADCSTSDGAVVHVLQEIAEDAGWSTGDIDSTAFSTLHGIISATVGRYITSDTSALSEMDSVSNCVGIWYSVIEGLLTCGRIENPSATADVTMDRLMIRRINRTNNTNIDPIWKVNVGYDKNWTVQNSDVAGVVSDTRRLWLKDEERISFAEDTDILATWLNAGILDIPAVLADESDASTEASRRLTLRGVGRFVYTIEVEMEEYLGIRLGNTVELSYPRFDLNNGVNGLVVSINYDFNSDTIEVWLWL